VGCDETITILIGIFVPRVPTHLLFQTMLLTKKYRDSRRFIKKQVLILSCCAIFGLLKKQFQFKKILVHKLPRAMLKNAMIELEKVNLGRSTCN